MSQKHLGVGDQLPPLQKEKLHIYSMKYCPFSHRVKLVLTAKNIDFEVINVNLKNKPAWLIERNPQGLVPILEIDDNKVIYEAMVICDYLEENYPGKALYPKESYLKAQQKMLITFFENKVSPPFYKYIFSNFEDETSKKCFYDGLEKLDKSLKNSGNFFGGETPLMSDYLFWPWFERMLMFDIKGKGIPADQFPCLIGWINRMKEDEVVKVFFMEPEVHYKFFVSSLEGKPQYDT